MQLTEAQALAAQLIATGETHQDYARTVELMDLYKKLITGKDCGSLLTIFNPREDIVLFEQRKRLFFSITPAVMSTIKTPFYEVARNDRIQKKITLDDPGKVTTVETMIARFYGSSSKKDKGLDYWLKTRFHSLSFSDPNSWLVTEWDAAPPNKPIEPRPFEVSAEMARNFFIVNDEVKWLWVREEITYMSMRGTARAPIPADGQPDVSNVPLLLNGNGVPQQLGVKGIQKKPGYRYTLYDADYTVRLEQVDKSFLTQSGYVFSDGEQLVQIKKDFYLMKFATPKLGYPPAIRLGYKFDGVTDDRTFVNPAHDAMCYFMETVKAVSEKSISMSLHVFPQKYQYVTPCPGEAAKSGSDHGRKCNHGRLANGEKCSECGGKGYVVHTSGQDAVYIPLPDDPNDMMDLSKLSYTAPAPIDTVKFQNEQILQLEQQCHRAVFNSQIFVSGAGSVGTTSAGAGQMTNTATGSNINKQSVYNAVEPFTEKVSEIYRFEGTTFAILAGANPQNITITHDYPEGAQLKSMEDLLADRAAANTAGAPQFLIEAYDDDIAQKKFGSDPAGMQEYRVKKQFYPFLGKSPDDVAMLVQGSLVPKEMKVLWANFDQIFTDLKEEDPDFYERDTATQNQKVRDKVQEYMDKLDAQAATYDLSRFTSPASVPTDDDADPNAGNGNAGNNPSGDDNPAAPAGPTTETTPSTPQ